MQNVMPNNIPKNIIRIIQRIMDIKAKITKTAADTKRRSVLTVTANSRIRLMQENVQEIIQLHIREQVQVRVSQNIFFFYVEMITYVENGRRLWKY